MQDGRTPLHLAAAHGRSEAVDLLCRHGASVDVRDSDAYTPLDLAGHYGHREAAVYLLSWGARSGCISVSAFFCMTVKQACQCVTAHWRTVLHASWEHAVC